MDSQQLRKRLEELHAELEQTQAVDEDTRRTLADIDGHIQTLLAGPDRDFTTRHHSLSARLRDSLTAFESSHPNLVPTVERVLDAFNEMGI
jgi:Domain of unknown function (DUF4404)